MAHRGQNRTQIQQPQLPKTPDAARGALQDGRRRRPKLGGAALAWSPAPCCLPQPRTTSIWQRNTPPTPLPPRPSPSPPNKAASAADHHRTARHSSPLCRRALPRRASLSHRGPSGLTRLNPRATCCPPRQRPRRPAWLGPALPSSSARRRRVQHPSSTLYKEHPVPLISSPRASPFLYFLPSQPQPPPGQQLQLLGRARRAHK